MTTDLTTNLWAQLKVHLLVTRAAMEAANVTYWARDITESHGTDAFFGISGNNMDQSL